MIIVEKNEEIMRGVSFDYEESMILLFFIILYKKPKISYPKKLEQSQINYSNSISSSATLKISILVSISILLTSQPLS